MSEMFPGMNPAEGPPPGEVAPDPAQVNGGPPADNGVPQTEPEGPGLDELVQGLGTALRAQTTKAQNADDPEKIKASSGACLALAQAIAALAPPMKPIDPQLHASTRGVDPQRALEMRHEAEMERVRQEHERDMADVQAAHAANQQGAEPSDTGGQTDGE